MIGTSTESDIARQKSYSTRGLFSRLKDQSQQFAHQPFATLALFLIAFLESSLLPIAPDLLLIPLCLARPKRSFWYALVVALGSTLGAILGYYIGLKMFDTVGAELLNFFSWHSVFENVLSKYREHAVSALLFAGFLPIPFQVFTIAAGWGNTIPLATFVAATFGGRLIRFFLVGGLLFVFGETAKVLLEKYFGKTVLIVGTLLIVWILASKLLS